MTFGGIRVAALCLGALLVSNPASAFVYQSGSLITSIFDDTLTLTSESADVTGPGTYLFNNVEFDYGGPTFGNGTGTVTRTITAAGFPDTLYDIAVSFNTSGPAHSVTLGGNSFVFAGYNFYLNPVTLGVSPFATTAFAELDATLTPVTAAVPEASTWAMLILGFAGIGLLARRRLRRLAALAA